MTDPGEASLSDRYAAVAGLVAGHGYEVRHQVGGADGTDWEITFAMPAMLEGPTANLYTVAAPTEGDLLRYLARWLPDRAARDWRQRALTLEGTLHRAQRGRGHDG